MSYQITEKDGFFVIENKNGETLSMAAPKLLEQDGFAFKDLAGTGELVPYEDWRLDPLTRAEDLAKRLSIEEIAGLMLYSSHQSLPAVTEGPFKSHYSGKSREEAGALKWDLTDEQKKFLSDDHIRHILLSLVSDPMTAARWSNELNKKCEELPFGIPVNIATDPRHGAPSIADAEFKSSESGVSIWPEGIGLTAAGDLGMVREFAKTAAKEYRAMGITTELGPQIDLATEPRWMRQEDTPGGDMDYSIAFTKAYCDGLQTTDGAVDGWGKDSVLAMVKHWPSGGTGEGGRDAHYPFGAFAVYPGGNFESGVKVFTEGAFKLDGPTKTAACVMPYYTVSWNQDTKNHENVGNSYSEYLIKDLLRGTYGYDGVVCTDWNITGDPIPEMDSFGPRCYGLQELSVAEQHYRIIMNGIDQFGGNNDVEPVLEAYRMGCDQYGEAFMRKRMEESAVRLLANLFRLKLFEDPYLDPEETAHIVGNADYRESGRKAQAASLVLLKDTGVLPLKKGIRLYVPQRKIKPRKNFIRWMDPERVIDPVKPEMSCGFFTLTDDPESADAALVIMESPSSNCYSKEDREAGGNGYFPISLQYRPYTADTAREVSIAGGDPREASANRSYKGKTSVTANEQDLDNVLNARKAMGDKPVIACVRVHNPLVPSEFEPYCDAIIAEFGVEIRVLVETLFGDRVPDGTLPYNLPADMETVEAHCEDLPDDYEAYTDSVGNTYVRGFALGKK